MGSQGFYPGSGAVNQHKELAQGKDVGVAGHNEDSHLKEGGPSSGLVTIVNGDYGKGASGEARAVNQE